MHSYSVSPLPRPERHQTWKTLGTKNQVANEYKVLVLFFYLNTIVNDEGFVIKRNHNEYVLFILSA